MTRATFMAAIALACTTAVATTPPVTFESPCECRNAHGKGRWAVKNDPAPPPADASAIQSVTPSDVYGWLAIDAQLTWQLERTGRENNWYSLTGRVVAVKVEADGDLHIALQDVTGNKAGIVVCEVPAGPQWCQIRDTVFSWTRTINETPIITVVGKAFWDMGHAPRDQSNRRKYMPGYSVWEIHPVMKLETL
jgi:hypothetical protein